MRFVSLLVFAVVALFAEVEYAESYKAALEQAKKENKMVMVMLSKEDCDACWYMENVVFEDEVMAEKIMKDFVVVHLDIHHDYLQDLTFIGTPTFHFLNAKGYKRDRYDGAANVKDFEGVIEAALKKNR